MSLMTLAKATIPGRKNKPRLRGPGPYACTELAPFRGVEFDLPPGDRRLRPIYDGGSATAPEWDNLVGMTRWWSEHTSWMNFLDPDSPGYHDKRLERQLYLDHFGQYIQGGNRVLDLGGGIGRFTQWLLEQDCSVELVDPDLRSLRCAVGHAAGGPGRLDVHWTTGAHLPEIEPVDVALAVEVLCYVSDPMAVLNNIRRVLRPGGMLLVSVEAQYGWAMSTDVADDTLEDLLTEGIVHVPRDRWVRTYDEARFRALLQGWEIVTFLPTHYVLSGPFELSAGEEADMDKIRDWEARLRAHPITGPLNRAWTAVVRNTG
jgi:SAM-dependent methyltransferase